MLICVTRPGERLPNFPPPTHSKDGSNGLKKWVTILEAISGIPDDAPDHDLEGAAFPAGTRTPYDGNVLAKCITTSGGIGNYHPSGKRNFTIREYACLQTFPLDHKFIGSYVKRQIGNAVPPRFAKILFRHIKHQLEERDGVVHEAVSLDI